jgi:RimJ/RimL family protein N-acetyltransferase
VGRTGADGGARTGRTRACAASRADGRDRTGDIRFTRAVLYQLSYVGVVHASYRWSQYSLDPVPSRTAEIPACSRRALSSECSACCRHRSMSSPSQLRTARLLLRRWRETDHAPFAALNADPMVMEHFPNRLTRADSDDLIARIEAGFATHGYGLWALEVRSTGDFVGFTGLAVPSFKAHFTPAVEVGWRLARSAWGKGYATEAGLASVAYGFRHVGLDEIVSFTSASNLRSRAVMERIGMTHDPAEDFDHPELKETDLLRPHVLYRVSTAAAGRELAQPTEIVCSSVP